MSQYKERRPGFLITAGRGFHMTFPNGYTVSVQFGPGNYCDHYDKLHAATPQAPDYTDYQDWARKLAEDGSSTAEVAVVAPQGGLINLHEFDSDWHDSVCGYATPAKVVELMVWTMLK